MKYLSLFTGIGGFELGIQQAYEKRCNSNKCKIHTESTHAKHLSNNRCDNVQKPLCIGYSENNRYAIQIYEKHFNHKNFGDITKINAKELPDFDLLVGGFPCQSFSIAGNRRGFSDTRGTLFFEIARIIREKQPRYLLLENVKGLLSHDKGRTFRIIIRTLDELGYDLQWQVLNSKNHGVPQNRERVFIVGHLRGTSRPEVFPIGEGSKLSTKGRRQGTTKSGISLAITANYHKGVHSGGETYAIQQLNNPIHSKRTQIFQDAKIRRLTPTECMRLQGFPDDWCDVGADGKEISNTQKYKVAGNAVTVNVVEEIITNLLYN